MRPALETLRARRDLSAAQMTESMRMILAGESDEESIASFLTLLREKGETVTEIVAAARVMRDSGVRTSRPHPDWLDTCGTGGDASHTLNVSTLASILCAAAGAKIAKHGNRSVSGICGSADILERLGVPVDVPSEAIEAGIETTGWGFLFAPLYHPAVKHAMGARKRIGGKTLFNVLGPLSNPTGAAHHLLGVYTAGLVRMVAKALSQLGCASAMIVHGQDGLDEISIGAPTVYAELENGIIREGRLLPEDVGIKRVPAASLRIEDAAHAQAAAQEVLGGGAGPAADIVCLNAGAGLRAAGLASSIAEGYKRIVTLQRSGAGAAKLEQIRSHYKRAA